MTVVRPQSCLLTVVSPTETVKTAVQCLQWLWMRFLQSEKITFCGVRLNSIQFSLKIYFNSVFAWKQVVGFSKSL